MPFILRHDTTCYFCGNEMVRGQQGYYFGEGNVAHHPSCPPKQETCNKCWTVRTPTGACNCD